MNTIETLDTAPFKYLIMTIGELPTSYLESMTYYEMLAWLCNYVQTKVIPAVNNNAEAVKEIQEWLKSIDIQSEVDTKLEEMVDDGTMARLINTTIFSQLDNRVTQNTSDIEALTGQVISTSQATTSNTNKINNLEEQVSTNTSNIQTQTSRIDSLATLEEGSTTGDAELTDARTNAFGRTSSSLGASIRNYEGATFESILLSCRSVEGIYVNFSGNRATHASATVYSFPTEEGRLYYISTKASGSAPQVIIGDKTYPAASGEGSYTDDIVIEGTGETCFVNYMSNVNVTMPVFIGATRKNSYAEEGWEDITSSVTKTTGKYIGNQGYSDDLRSSSTYLCYEFVPEEGYEYLIHTSINDSVPFLRQVGGNTITPSTSVTGGFSGTWKLGYGNGGKIYVNGILSTSNWSYKADTFIKKRKCFSFKNRGYYNGVTDKLVCVGDSLIYGQTYTGASQSYRNFFNIPHYLSKKLGCSSVSEIATPGATSSSWWTAYNESLTEANSLYVVWLGTNDNFTDTVSTDCAGDDYTQYANNETGDFGRILGKIKALGNNKIVLVNCFTTSGTLATNNKVIADLAAKFDATVVNVKDSEIKDRQFHTAYNAYYNGTHLNNAGNNYVSELIAKTIGNAAINGKLEIYKAHV